ncbi:SMI1/KNR4 family protein [uncultured Dokdonia sp.]|uniref:SMI1/KNR4 family protein n=1 Tax=uncultured Dokdonia sp. TaxID=575653 RepID=UPI00260E381B|nr:SMI1/KNR4 family protein [uncultured Dokdonia sp.]
MENFLRHINLKKKQFKCYSLTGKNKESELIFEVKNEIHTGANDNEINLLTKLIPSYNEEIIELYKHHNGMTLYLNKDESGIKFSSINYLEQFNREWKVWFESCDEDDLLDYHKSGIAFAEISHSGNYFVLFNGKVFYFDHGDFTNSKPIAHTVKEFLSLIVKDPITFLHEMGNYTRYFDGKTNKEWIPKEFIAI